MQKECPALGEGKNLTISPQEGFGEKSPPLCPVSSLFRGKNGKAAGMPAREHVVAGRRWPEMRHGVATAQTAEKKSETAHPFRGVDAGPSGPGSFGELSTQRPVSGKFTITRRAHAELFTVKGFRFHGTFLAN